MNEILTDEEVLKQARTSLAPYLNDFMRIVDVGLGIGDGPIYGRDAVVCRAGLSYLIALLLEKENG